MKEFLIFHIIYKWKYRLAQFKSIFFVKSKVKQVSSATFVAREADKDWIFGAKVRRLAKYSGLNSTPYFHAKLRNLPVTDGYFFVFPQYFCRAIRHNPHILNKKNIVMFTHTNWTNSYSKTHVIWCLNLADKVICLNSDVKNQLIKDGVKSNSIEVLHIASNPDFFYAHERKNHHIGFCSTFSNRKNPDLIFDLVKNNSQDHFYMIGRNWEQYKNYKELISFENFTYFNDYDYEKYPELYSLIDIFVSPSFIEGGPVPLLEAMLSNCVPIATNTGFAPDIINHGINGYLFDSGDSWKQVSSLIQKAKKNKTNIRETVLPFSWENCAKRIDTMFNS